MRQTRQLTARHRTPRAPVRMQGIESLHRGRRGRRRGRLLGARRVRRSPKRANQRTKTPRTLGGRRPVCGRPPSCDINRALICWGGGGGVERTERTARNEHNTWSTLGRRPARRLRWPGEQMATVKRLPFATPRTEMRPRRRSFGGNTQQGSAKKSCESEASARRERRSPRPPRKHKQPSYPRATKTRGRRRGVFAHRLSILRLNSRNVRL